MTIRSQHVPIKTPVANPPAAPGPCNLTAATINPNLFLKTIQVVGSAPTGSATSGKVAPGTSTHAGSAKVVETADKYKALCDAILANPSQMSVDIQYDDQTDAVTDFTFTTQTSILVTAVEKISRQIDLDVGVQLKNINETLLAILTVLRKDSEPREEHHPIESHIDELKRKAT